MLTVISPAKTLDFDTAPITRKTSFPDYLDRSKQLISLLRAQTPAQLGKMMGISHKLAELNVERFRTWNPPFSRSNARQAILAFRGDVYLGLDVDNYGPRDITFAQKNMRILSGLYGLLRPLDLIAPYRLEMGTRLPNPKGKDLYEFWGAQIAEGICAALAKPREKTLINLASQEYFRSIRTDLLPGKVITPVFKDYSGGSYKVLSFFAKKARGQMTTFIVKNRINRPQDIKAFDVDGYGFDEASSSDTTWIFTRKS
jgi:uncharacterized protein